MKIKKRRWMLCLLVLALVLTNICMVGLAAGETPTVSVSSGEVKVGESVTLTVSVENNPGVAVALFYLYYDTSVFTLDESYSVRAAGVFGEEGSVIANSIAAAKESGSYDGDARKDGVAVLWYNGYGANVSEDDIVLRLKLIAASDAVNGCYPVTIGYSAENTVNESGETVKFNLVSGSVTVTGGNTTDVVVPSEEEEVVSFPDVDGHWAEAEIRKAAELGLVQGYEDGTYGPDRTMTRAECVTILWRAAGSPKPRSEASFTDLTQDWYKEAIAWAEENSVVNGVGNGKFNPTGFVTREQLATILHRVAGTPVGMEMMWAGIYDSNFKDSALVGSWAKNAVYWAVYAEIYCGESSLDVGTELKPTAYANRAQIAVMMVRYLDKY